MDLPVVAWVKALRHAEDDPCASVGHHDEITVLGIHRKPLYLTGQDEIVHRAEQRYLTCLQIYLVKVVRLVFLGVTVIAGDEHLPVHAVDTLLESRGGGECQIPEVLPGLEVVAVKFRALYPVGHPDLLAVTVNGEAAAFDLAQGIERLYSRVFAS